MFGLGELFKNKKTKEIKGVKITDIPDLYKTRRLQLRIIRKDNTMEFNVQIKEIDKEKNQLHLAFQYVQRGDFNMNSGDKILLVHKYYRGVLEWECSKVDDYKLEYLDILVVEQKEKMQRVNKREFFRIRLRMNFKYDYLDKNAEGELEDISYKGLKFNTTKKHDVEDRLRVHIGDLVEHIKIVRLVGENDQDKFVYGAKFIHPNENIEKYVNKKQIELLGKE